ncbi:MAG: NAD-dependent DNA ligase LigA [Prevotellaceae bacterium]|nr:NAD-dependent DNA ligase LigA [Prevotellaceae bacterium]
MNETTLQRMRQLVDELNRAADAYYDGQSELMTDYEWDARFDELRRLEQEAGETLADSPTQRVSADNIAGQKEEHEYAALSLAKTKSPDDLVKWAEGRPVWFSWKLDGLTLVVTYDGGRLSKIVTRGNGHEGTVVTHLANAIHGIPATISYRGHLVVRGEAVISYDDFERFLMETDADYANPRNLASGSLTLKDVSEVRQRNLRWLPFTLVHTDDDSLVSWGEQMRFLASQGMHCVDHECVADPTLEHVTAAIDRWTQRVTDHSNPFPVDGLVICYDDTAYAATGSVTGHHATRAGIAFKWQDEAAATELEHVEWSCATGTISPVAVFRPVELEGTTVRRASLCNISECERLGIGGAGTVLSVIKANKIIPKVIHVERTVGTLCVPDRCPVCEHPTEIVCSERGTRTLHCTNAACPAKQLRKFARFVSKEGVDIDGISEQTLARFVNMGWISEVADIYDLPLHLPEMAQMEGFGKKSAQKIKAAIERATVVDATKLLYALSIPLCGIDVCKRLLAAYSLDDLIRTASTTTESVYFTHIAGIGPEKSAAFVRWFHNEQNRQSVERLLSKVRVREDKPLSAGNRCANMTFVITGDVHHYRNRKELQAYIESQGGKVSGSVSGATNFLINNDLQSASSKNQRARQLGIPILSEDEFIRQFGDDTAAVTSTPSTPFMGNLFA